jgi:hypothetical protein
MGVILDFDEVLGVVPDPEEWKGGARWLPKGLWAIIIV